MFKIGFLIVLALSTNLVASYEYSDKSLGNIAIEAGIWKSDLDGNINNYLNTTDFNNDLGYTNDKNINTFALDLKNDFKWLPNIRVDYFKLNNSESSILTSTKNINGTSLNGSVSSIIDYSEINAILYGYLAQGPFEFDLGLNLKKIDFEQEITENILNGKKITIKGPSSIVPLPYCAIKLNINAIDTVLAVETSMLSIGDTEAKDYKYSISYRVMRHMYITYGYRYNSFKSKNSNTINNEKYDVKVKGNYLNVKILF